MRDQSNAIREQVSFKQQEEHIRDSWNFLCDHYQLNKSDLVKFLIKKEECFLKKPEAIPSGFFQGWLWALKIRFKREFNFYRPNWILWSTTCQRPTSSWWQNWIHSNGIWWNSRYKTSTLIKPMNNSTKTLIREIQTKLKSPITKEREFSNESAVIDYAVKTLYDLLKKQRLIWHSNQYQSPLIRPTPKRFVSFKKQYQIPPRTEWSWKVLWIQDTPMPWRPFTNMDESVILLCNKAFRNYQSIFVRVSTVEFHWVPWIYKVLRSTSKKFRQSIIA